MNSLENFSQIVHKNYIISLFKNRMIIQNSKSEREAKILAAKIIGK